MNALVISYNSPWISKGGIERYLSNLLNYSRNRPHQLFFLLPSNGKKDCEKVGNVVIYHKDFLPVMFTKDSPKLEISNKEVKEKSSQFFWFLSNLFKRRKMNLVYAQNFQKSLPASYSILLSKACFSRNTPLILRIHYFLNTDTQISILKDVRWGKIICDSNAIANDCQSKGVSSDKLIVKYLGVDTEIFNQRVDKLWLKKFLHLPKDQKIILHASRITNRKKALLKEKGVITLLKAFSKLEKRHQDVKLVIAIAEPPKELREKFNQALEELNRYIKLCRIEKNTVYKTFSLEKMPLVYAGSDIFVLASENEPFGLAYIEAMACGIPVIGSNTGGVPELIKDNQNGFLIPVGDVEMLAEKTSELLMNKKLKNNFVKAGLKIINQKFSAHHQFDDLFNYFEGACKELSSK